MKKLLLIAGAAIAASPALAAPVGLVDNADIPYTAKWTPGDAASAVSPETITSPACWPVKGRAGNVLYWTGTANGCGIVVFDGGDPRRDTPPTTPPYCDDDKPKPDKPKGHKGPKGNNGWGNGSQDAPGKSGPRNNAENGPKGKNDGRGKNSGNSGKGGRK